MMYNAVADKHGKIVADLEWGKRWKIVGTAVKVQNVVNTVGQDNVVRHPGRSIRNNVDVLVT